MDEIKRCLEIIFGNYTIFHEDKIELDMVTEIVRCMVIDFASRIDDRWMLRITTRSGFDKWSNSTAIEKFFNTKIELCNWLYEHQLDIYKDLLLYLSAINDDDDYRYEFYSKI